MNIDDQKNMLNKVEEYICEDKYVESIQILESISFDLSLMEKKTKLISHCLYQIGCQEKAFKELENFYIDKYKADLQKGWLLFNIAKYDFSEKHFKALFEKCSTADVAQGWIASLRKQRKFYQAVEIFEKYQNKFSKDSGYMFEKGWILVEKLQYESAQRYFKLMKICFPNSKTPYEWVIECLVYMKNFHEVRCDLRLAREKFPEFKIIWDLQEAKLFHAMGNFHESVSIFNKVLELDSYNRVAIQGKLASIRLLGNLSNYEFVISKIPSFIKKDIGIRREIALFIRVTSPSNSLNIINEIVMLPQSSVTDRLDLAEILCEIGGYENLKKAEEICWDLHGSGVEVSRLFGTVGTILIKKEIFEEAEKYLKMSINLDKFSEYYAVLSSIYMSRGDIDECLKVVETGLQYQPSSAALSVQKGKIQQKLNQMESAVNTFKYALRLEPKSFDAKMGLIGAFIEAERLEELEAYLSGYIKFELDKIKRDDFRRIMIQLMIKKFEDTRDPTYLQTASKEIDIIDHIKSKDVVLRGIVFAKAGKNREAYQEFIKAYKADETNIISKMYADRIKIVLTQENRNFNNVETKSWIVASISVLLIFFICYLRLISPPGIGETSFVALLPISMIFLISSFVLPYLNKLSISGIEIQLEGATERLGIQVPIDALRIGRDIRVDLPLTQ